MPRGSFFSLVLQYTQNLHTWASFFFLIVFSNKDFFLESKEKHIFYAVRFNERYNELNQDIVFVSFHLFSLQESGNFIFHSYGWYGMVTIDPCFFDASVIAHYVTDAYKEMT